MNELMRKLLYLPEQASTIARDIDYLHYAVVSTTMLGSVLVFLVAIILYVRYRRRPGTPLRTEEVHIPLRQELALGLGLLLLFLLFWVVGFNQYIRLYRPPPNAMDVYVMGKQWMWKFTHPEGPATVGTLYVPANRPVRLLITSRDVIHSFFVPAFRIKQDAVPGRYTVAWFEAKKPGVYPMYCAEYCGTGHSIMRADVVVLSPEDYERWLEEPTGWASGIDPSRQRDQPVVDAPVVAASQRVGLIEQGVQAAGEYGCLRCHSLDGTPHLGPTWWQAFGRPVTLLDGTQVLYDEAYITESMMDPMKRLTEGFPPMMPSYRGLIPPAETAAIIELIRSLGREDEPTFLPTGREVRP